MPNANKPNALCRTIKVAEFNKNFNDVNDNYVVLLNLECKSLVVGYRSKGVWYDNWTQQPLGIDDSEIVSFIDLPVDLYYHPRKNLKKDS